MRTDLRGACRLLVHRLSLAATCVLVSGSAASAHVDSPYLPEECGSCHVGHGLAGQPMLDRAEESFCYRCHGAEDKRTREIAEGRLSPGVELKDVEREFQKPYRHPVVEGQGHSPTEQLDGARLAAVSHAECVDCHDPHERALGLQRSVEHEVSGLSITGQTLERSRYEYEICLKCHGDRPSAGPATRTLREEFDVHVRSQHPVTREPSGREMPSLLPEVAGQRLWCSDCHGNDDPNGPRGPHGSMNRFLLAGNYDMEVYAEESPLAYQLCYGCHDRSSILADESFAYHRLHIEGDPVKGRRGTSCFTCHASHGVPGAPALIEFNPQAVDPEPTTLRLDYRPVGPRGASCTLSCHGHDHRPEVFR